MNKLILEAKSPEDIKKHFTEFAPHIRYQNAVVEIAGALEDVDDDHLADLFEYVDYDEDFVTWLKNERPDLEDAIDDVFYDQRDDMEEKLKESGKSWHHMTKCRKCEKIIMNCRCSDKTHGGKKPVKYEICKECKNE